MVLFLLFFIFFMGAMFAFFFVSVSQLGVGPFFLKAWGWLLLLPSRTVGRPGKKGQPTSQERKGRDNDNKNDYK